MPDTLIDPIPPSASGDAAGGDRAAAPAPAPVADRAAVAVSAAVPAPVAVSDPAAVPASDPAAAAAPAAAADPADVAGLRPTVIEPAAPDGGPVPGPVAPRPARSSRKGCIAAALSSVLTVLAAAAIVFYFFFWKYEPLARRHIPGDANVAFRIEGADIVLFGPVRKHLWPLLDQASSGKSRTARIKEATGVSLGTDVREILVASTDAASWVVLLGGRIPPSRFVSGLERVAREEGWSGWRRDGDFLIGPGGVAIGQADDGTIALGTEAEIVRAAIPASDEWQRLGLPEEGAVSFAITREAWGGVGAAIGGMLPRGGAGLFRRASRATGSMTLGASPALSMRVDPAAGEAASALASDVETILGDLKLITLILPDTFGEKGALRSARVEAKGSAVDVHAEWPLEGLDRACERLAQLLKARSGGESAAPPPSR